MALVMDKAEVLIRQATLSLEVKRGRRRRQALALMRALVKEGWAFRYAPSVEEVRLRDCSLSYTPSRRGWWFRSHKGRVHLLPSLRVVMRWLKVDMARQANEREEKVVV